MRRKILVVDDEQEIRQFLDLVLREKGFEVLAAGGGAEALGLAGSAGPQLVLLDIMMPEIDGWTVLERLKSAEPTARIPVAMLSARTEAADRARALRAGAADYITKPFSLRDLLGRIEAILGSS
jgi:DNA-binding response OmpR family regulator